MPAAVPAFFEIGRCPGFFHLDYSAYIEDNDEFRRLAAALGAGPARAYAPSFFQGFLLSALAATAWSGRAVMLVAPDAASASRLATELRAYAPVPVCLLPARGVARGTGLTPSRQVVGSRHAALAALAQGSPCFVVADVAALMERESGQSVWPEPLLVRLDNAPGFDDAVEALALLGYERIDQVEDPGQFSVRGGIIDVYPSGAAAPVRLEYWGDELESLRRFSPFTQKSLAALESVTIYAAAEPEGGAAEAGETAGAGEAAGAAAAGDDVAGTSLLDRPYASALCRLDPSQAAGTIASLWDDAVDQLEDGAGRLYLDPEEMKERLEAAAALTLESLPADQPHRFAISGVESGSRRFPEAARRLDGLIRSGLRVFVHFATEGAARRAEHGLEGKAKMLEAGTPLPVEPGAWLMVAPAPLGFSSRELKLAVMGERALLRPSRSARSQQLALGGRAVLSFRDLRPGDYVVHDDHGIGLFDSIQTRTVAGVTRDYLLLIFRGEDRLFVPQEQIAKVSRYIGAGAGSPTLNKLGGRAWQLTRARARSAAREMAGELLQLYAVRQSLPGVAFSADNQWQLELEAAFPYGETPDQAAAIDDVKEDMESPHPMDRLVCGDVGYGKTEVALRAAFKAVSQGRQVLMLVPTTILALQHYNTFSSRFERFPVTVQMISRFRSPAQSRRIAADFHAGKVDMLIGTHRLLSSDVAPHDLGLVIVDEEQRFGVAQKEALRQLRLKVDVLSLSATPIPRTLQMSLSGIRDIRIMETPPAGRNPIRTYVGEFDDKLVGQAIDREIRRGGQAFFLHNRVETIEAKADELRALFPRVRFLVAHGQMPEGQLETVMVSFLSREADVLVCTSIIESGLDIPTANTLIVNYAQLLGLSQLYQIRGRIGRSETIAHAYLFYPPEAELTHEAMARLSTLSDYTELGSGFKIAMRDLEIRGAGNLLGDEQSGHVAAVGFDMYCDLIRRAVAELRDKPVEDLSVARLDIDADAYIPADYISFEAARIDVHHRIAAARDEQELEELLKELRDRFGEPPEMVYNLMSMQEIRLRAAVLGAATVTYRRNRLELGDIRLDSGQRTALEKSGLKFAFHPLKRTLTIWPGEEEGLSVVKRTLDVIIDSLLTPVAKL